MNKLLYLSAIGVLATGMACSSQRAADSSTNREGNSTAQDSATATNTDAAANNASKDMNNAARAANADSQSGDMGQLQGEDKDFAMKAAQGGMAEVQLGQLAQQKAQNPQVKQFGAMMVKDHTMANDKLKQVISAKGGSAPTDLDSEHKSDMDQISNLSGAEFDKAYMDHMVQDHEKDVAEFQKASQGAQDPQLKQFATQTLPKLKQHLSQAQKVQKAVSKGSQSASNQHSGMNQ